MEDETEATGIADSRKLDAFRWQHLVKYLIKQNFHFLRLHQTRLILEQSKQAFFHGLRTPDLSPFQGSTLQDLGGKLFLAGSFLEVIYDSPVTDNAKASSLMHFDLVVSRLE